MSTTQASSFRPAAPIAGGDASSLASGTPLPSGTTAHGGLFLETFDALLDQVRNGDFMAALRGLQSADFRNRPAEDQQRIIRALVARTATHQQHRPHDLAQATAAAVTLLSLIEQGVISPDSFQNQLADAFANLVNSVSDSPAFASVVAQGEAHGLSPSIIAFLQRFDFNHTNLSEISRAIFDRVALDPRHDSDAAQPAPTDSRFSETSNAPPAAVSAGMTGAIQLMASIESQMDALIQTLELGGESTSQSALASLKARMDILGMQMDIAVGVLDRTTNLLTKIGQAYNR